MSDKLSPHGDFAAPKNPLLYIIMDGVGLGKNSEENAFYQAKTPYLDGLFAKHLNSSLYAHGTYVGLPDDGDMGNSEIGHNVMGSGRIIDQGAKLIAKAFTSGRIFEEDSWKKVVEKGKKGGMVHFIGLFSDGNVHSHLDHLYSLIGQFKEEGVSGIRVHALLDGRDVGEKSALDYIEPAEKLFAQYREEGFDICFASGGGRMNVTMDRYGADWSIVQRGWDAHVHGTATPYPSMEAGIASNYKEGKTDQYFDSFTIVDEAGDAVGRIQDGDAVILFNFRGDRAIEISRAFDEGADFTEIDRGRVPDVFFAGIMEYDSDLKIPKNFLVSPPSINHTLSEYLCALDQRSFATAETQKFGHVTYFWNGNRSGKFDEKLETYHEERSDNVPFDQTPEMKAPEVTQAMVEAIESDNYDFLRVNLANGDMVGHTGVLSAAIKSMECVDRCVGKMVDAALKKGASVIVTADHGNLDIMYKEKDGIKTPITSHTLNPVPFIAIPAQGIPPLKMNVVKNAGLANMASTILYLMGYSAPKDYLPPLLKKG